MHHSTVDSSARRAIEKLERDMGTSLLDALRNPKTVELMVNPDGKVWLEKLGEAVKEVGEISSTKAQGIIETVAGFHRKTVTRESPLLEAEFPIDGSRFAGQIPPVVQAPCFAIRKKAIAVFTLAEYVDQDIMTKEQYATLKSSINEHRNILVSGGTGSGKTTLINAIINEMHEHGPNERVVVIEDTGEIQCKAANHIQYHTTADVTMTMLLKATLRMRPDRILVGEVRGKEALDLLDAWNTGHPGGAATVHANSAQEALTRLGSLVTRNEEAPTEVEPLIAQAVHTVVHIARTPKGRKVEDIIAISDYLDGSYITKRI